MNRISILTALMFALLHLPSTSHGTTIVTSLSPKDAASLLDILDDGNMQFNAAIGHGTEEWNYSYVDTRLDGVNDTDRFARSGVDFELAGLAGQPISSAKLIIQPYFARDLMTSPFGLPLVEVWGYVGDGFVDAGDLLGGRFLTSFAPVLLDSSKDRGPDGWAPVELDVTEFIQDLTQLHSNFAGFRLNISGDLSAQRNLFSEFAWGGSGATNGTNKPRLTLATNVPEPASMALVGVGIASIFGIRRRKAWSHCRSGFRKDAAIAHSVDNWGLPTVVTEKAASTADSATRGRCER